jgi:RNA polymerase sigma-70 factor (ECF subfamily)
LTPAAIQGLYERHSFALFRRCRRLLHDADEAQDAMQEVFLKVLENPAQFQGRSAVSTYLFGVATHLCLNRVRNRSARDERWQVSVAEALHERPPDVHDGVEARQLASAILAEEDAETAAMVVYHFVDGLTQGEIATLLGRSRVLVNQRLMRFRRAALARVEGV